MHDEFRLHYAEETAPDRDVTSDNRVQYMVAQNTGKQSRPVAVPWNAKRSPEILHSSHTDVEAGDSLEVVTAQREAGKRVATWFALRSS